MTLRSILLASSVLPLALSVHTPAFSQAAPSMQVAQADACAPGDDACQAKQDKKKKRQERRAQQDQDQGSQPAAGAPDADQGGGDKKKKHKDQADQQQSEQPAAASSGDNGNDGGDKKKKHKDNDQADGQQSNQPAAAAAAAPTAGNDDNAGNDKKKKHRDKAQGQSDGDSGASAATPSDNGDQNANGDRRKKHGDQDNHADQPQGNQSPAPATPPSGDANGQNGRRHDQHNNQAQQNDQGANAKAADTADTVADPGQDKGSDDDRKKRREARRKAREQQAEQQPATKQVDPNASTVEQQLQSQGSEKQAQKIRDLKIKLREARRDTPQGYEVVEQQGDRQILRRGGQVYIQPADNGESERLLYGASDVRVEPLPNRFSQTTVYRDNGSQIVTIRDPDGNIVNRVRRSRDGEDFVLIDNRYGDQPPPPEVFEQELPPVVVRIPRNQYIVDTQEASEDDLERAFSAPAVERVERPYTLDEIRRSERLRDKVRRVDLDTITFDTGSAVVSSEELDALDQVGSALEDVLAKKPDTVFLIEGHTDAVGSDTDNLVLSDKRAEAVAVALSQDFNIPPENLITQGYGEQYLKVPVQGDERENRRVTIRNISPLLSASAK